MELQEKFEKSADLDEVMALEEFSAAFDVIKDDLGEFHDDYAELQKGRGRPGHLIILTRLDQLSGQIEDILEAVYGLPIGRCTESMVEMLQKAVEAEFDALFDVIAAWQTRWRSHSCSYPYHPSPGRSHHTTPPLDTSPTIPQIPTATPPKLEPGGKQQVHPWT